MDPRIVEEVSLPDLFEQFVEATTMRNVLAIHRRLLNYADLSPCEFNIFYPKFKRAITASRQKKNWKAKALFSKIDKRATHKCYSNTKTSATSASSDKTCDTLSSSRRGREEVEQDDTNCDEERELSTSSLHSDDTRNAIFSNNNALKHYNCLVIGSGPAGLRTAIELQLLGASRVVIVEKRGRFSRNNVLHLWPFVIDDLKSLGAKKFYGKFCAGSIDHISIRQLQLMLLKVCLMIGCDFRDSCSYIDLCSASLNVDKRPERVAATTAESNEGEGPSPKCELYGECQPETGAKVFGANEEGDVGSEAMDQAGDKKTTNTTTTTTVERREINLKGVRAHFQCDHKPQEAELHSLEWDIIVGADGRRNTLSSFFPRIEFRGRLAIAITANFINRQTPTETSVPEISGLSFIYNQDMFNTLAYDTNIQLENICYYKDDTHYFVMTAKKRSLLERGVLIKDFAATKDLLSDDNVDKEALLKYAKDAAFWTTGLEPLDFALNHYGQEDCAMFDFTSVYAASNACRALRTANGGFALLTLVGDSLLEPFWPTGSGCARGFLSSFDAAWMCRQWAVNKCAVIDQQHGSLAGAPLSSSSRSSSSGKNRSVGATTKTSSDLSEQQQATTYDRMAMNVIAERESIYRILAQTTSENLQQNYAHWTLNPHTRYPNLNRHLVSPGQVEHLVASNHHNQRSTIDRKLLSPTKSTTGRRVKSPVSHHHHRASGARRSPKKLKSAGASPQTQPRNSRNQYGKSSGRSLGYKSRSRNDLMLDEEQHYLEFEQSYRDLDDNGQTQYLNYKQRNSADLDDLFIPSLSGTLPSSNNLSKLEARKARDIDECLRQRRQKSKIHVVRDQLISQMRGQQAGSEKQQHLISGGNAVLFNEIRRLRESQSRGARADSKPRDVSTGPLSLLNSMRRCASFAERVKSFESKLTSNHLGQPDTAGDSSVPSTPKTPIDNVKNLPQFATLQELIINNSGVSTQQGDATSKRARIPIARLSKDDWNVKCWEKRLNYKQPAAGLSLSSRSLNKAVSVDSGRDQSRTHIIQRSLNAATKPKAQIDVFQDRIKQMAGKLERRSDKENGTSGARAQVQMRKVGSLENRRPLGAAAPPQDIKTINGSGGGWINHLKRELSKGAEGSGSRRSVNGQPMNPVQPNKPIKKLFEDADGDDDNEDDGIDVNKHYDHLCVNRPTNKYLSKGAYTSHLARNKYNSATSKVINIRPKVSAESKQAYLATLTSRGSSASSTLSDYSTGNTGGNSSSGSAGISKARLMGNGNTTVASLVDVECFRCKKFVSTSERITINSSASLHRSCLTCAQCALTLRTNEIQHYLAAIRVEDEEAKVCQPANSKEPLAFLCAICKPDIRADLTREADSRLAATMRRASKPDDSSTLPSISQPQRRLQSREDFLSSKINYNELYKNLLDESLPSKKAESAGSSIPSGGSGRWHRQQQPSKVTPSPTQVTLPLNLVTRNGESGSQSPDDSDGDGRRSSSSPSDRRSSEFSIAESHTALDGNEHVTVILSSNEECDDRREDSAPAAARSNKEAANKRRVSKESEMIDEEELQRILHLDNRQTSRKSSDASSSGESEDSVADENDGSRRRQRRDGSTVSGVSSLDHHSEGSSSVGGGGAARGETAEAEGGDGADGDSSAANTDDNSSSLETQSDLDE